MCVCVCVRERERKRERESDSLHEHQPKPEQWVPCSIPPLPARHSLSQQDLLQLNEKKERQNTILHALNFLDVCFIEFWIAPSLPLPGITEDSTLSADKWRGGIYCTSHKERTHTGVSTLIRCDNYIYHRYLAARNKSILFGQTEKDENPSAYCYNYYSNRHIATVEWMFLSKRHFEKTLTLTKQRLSS